MNLIDTPTVELWVLPPGNLLVTAVTEAGETCITLAVTVQGEVDRPGAALVAIAHALSQAKRKAVTEGR
jgi:hypothetical protein